MTDISTAVTLRELNNTVLSLQSKVVSLEKLIGEQNKLIKKLLSNKSELVQICEKEAEGNCTQSTIQQPAPRPIREARIRAASAISVNARKLTARPATTTTDRAATSPTVTPTPKADRTSQLTTIAPTRTVPQVEALCAENTDSEWIEVKRRRNRRAIENVIRGTAPPASTSLLPAERKSYLHLYYVKVGTTVEQVITHLKNICAEDVCSVEVLKSRGDYASFKLSVPTKHCSKYLSPENWAVDVHIKPWHSGFRNKKGTQISET